MVDVDVVVDGVVVIDVERRTAMVNIPERLLPSLSIPLSPVNAAFHSSHLETYQMSTFGNGEVSVKATSREGVVPFVDMSF